MSEQSKYAKEAPYHPGYEDAVPNPTGLDAMSGDGGYREEK